jgi:glycosyltransferase involved in cell wall biosynthesis
MNVEMQSSPAKEKLLVAIFRDQPAENWPSMERYANELLRSLRHLPSPPDIQAFTPPAPWKFPRALLLQRSFHYPIWAYTRQRAVNHVLDHSYGHLLLTLDPRRTIVTVHDIAPLLFAGKRVGLSGLVWKQAWRGALRACHLITDSEFMRQTLIERFAQPATKITAVPLGVNSIFQPVTTSECAAVLKRFAFPKKPLILHVGSTQPRKNVERLFQALACLQQQKVNFTFIQAGGVQTPSLRELSQQLNLQQSVHFLGPVSEAELLALYNVADVFVFPSLYEGFGLPVLEAMACGTPVITSNVSSLPEVAGDAAVLLNPHHTKAMAEEIGRILESPALAEAVGKRGLERAKQFTWENTAVRTFSIYEQVAKTV